MKIVKSLIIIISILFFAGMIAEQICAETTLAEAAKKEKERKAKAAKPPKLINNETLKNYMESKGESPGTVKEDTESQTTQTAKIAKSKEVGGSEEFKGPTDLEGHNEDYWRNRIKSAKDRIQELEKRAEELQTKMNGLKLSFGAIDDPNQRELLNVELGKTAQDLMVAQNDLQKSKQDLESIREDGRKQGALPGWIYD